MFYGVLASLSSLFEHTYAYLSETDLGLCFLSVGGGMILGSMVTGRLQDRDYRVTRDNLVCALKARSEGSISDEDAIREVTREDVFPIEKARLRSSPLYLLIITACNVGYGWTLEKSASIAVPLILQFISECLASTETMSDFSLLITTSWIRHCCVHEYQPDTFSRLDAFAWIVRDGCSKQVSPILAHW